MSQHFFNTTHEGQPIQVLLGWDRPLGHFFLVIEKLPADQTAEAGNDEEDEDDGYLYSNLNDDSPFGYDLDYYKAKLKELGITVPQTMFEQILADQAHKVGNRQVWYEADGTFSEP